MPAIVGELAAGVIWGPSLLLHVLPGASRWLFPADANQMHLLDGTAQAGAVLLVGITGTQLDLRLLRRMGGTALHRNPGQLILAAGSIDDAAGCCCRSSPPPPPPLSGPATSWSRWPA
jgi:hypothetical protein